MLKKLIVPGIITIIIWALLFFLRMGEPYYALEAFWITGIFMLLQAFIYWITNEGIFYGLSWSMGKILDMFRRNPKYPMKYFEYVQMKRERPKLDIWPTFIIGIIFFLIGLIWWLLIA